MISSSNLTPTRRLTFESLENRQLLFANNSIASELAPVRTPIHENITLLALDFLREDVLDELVVANVGADIHLALDGRAHFDNSTFIESVDAINSRYRSAVFDFTVGNIHEVQQSIGINLHAIQDFYSHSNWANHHLDFLVDDGLGEWEIRVNDANTTPVFLQGEVAPSLRGWSYHVDKNDLSQVFVKTSSGELLPAIVTGTVALSLPSGNQAPISLIAKESRLDSLEALKNTLSHDGTDKNQPDGLNHDHNGDHDTEPRPYFFEALDLALRQTTHEFSRFCHLLRDFGGEFFASQLIADWARPDARSREIAGELCGLRELEQDAASGTFTVLPNGTHANSLSADGRFVVGSFPGGLDRFGRSITQGFRWSEHTGLELVGEDGVDTTIVAVDGDGSHAIGNSNGTGFIIDAQSFVWDDVGVHKLQSGEFVSFLATDISSDGNAIIGIGHRDRHSFEPDGALISLDSGEIAILPTGFRPVAIDASGEKIVGAEPVVWSKSSGLQQLPNEFFVPQVASISGDGRTVVGTASIRGDYVPVRWTENSPTSINEVVFGGGVYDVSADGSVMVGWWQDDPFIWTASEGPRLLDEFLAVRGIDTGKWRLRDSVALSADGRTIVGNAISLESFDSAAWILQLGSPMDDPLDNQNTTRFVDRISAAIVGGVYNLLFDLDMDDDVDQQDRRKWVEEVKQTFFGDANLDGVFDSSDFVLVFQAGKYERDDESDTIWSSGDWNGDGKFDSSDLVLAFQSNGFEKGPRS
ncbi:hypothetical protein ACFL2H_07455 [Planctomycetota bacterium]